MKRKINISLTDATGKEFKFETLRQIESFCKKEHVFWIKANASIGENITLNQAYTKANQLEKIVSMFDSWKETEPAWDNNTFISQFQHLQNNLLQYLSGDWVWHGHPFVQIWIDLHKKAQPTADSFLLTVLNRNPTTIASSVDHLKGHILGYEFLMQNESEITKRNKSEKRSISQLRDELIIKNNELVSNVDGFKVEIETWSSSKRQEIEMLIKVRQRLAERQIKNQERKFIKELSEWRGKVTNLENTYEELLRLRKPAEYWNKAAIKYRSQGVAFTALIIVLAFAAMFYLQDFFITWLQGKERALSLSTLQGVVIFGSFAAIFAFIIKVLSRLAFSSFHLMRDSEEREQLTYLYLSLSEETNVDEGARNIILQALFCRSETGLLKQDHGPTMPSVEDAIKYASKSKPQ